MHVHILCTTYKYTRFCQYLLELMGHLWKATSPMATKMQKFCTLVTVSPASVFSKVRLRRREFELKIMSYRQIRSPLASFLLPRLATAVVASRPFSPCSHSFGFKGHNVLVLPPQTMSLIGKQQASVTFLSSSDQDIQVLRSTKTLQSPLDIYKSQGRTEYSSIQVSPWQPDPNFVVQQEKVARHMSSRDNIPHLEKHEVSLDAISISRTSDTDDRHTQRDLCT